jgi:hypothetical protein
MISFVSSKGRHLSESVVDSHEAGVLRELGDDFSRAHPLSLTCYRTDGHEALFKDMPPYTACPVPEYSVARPPKEVSSRIHSRVPIA